MEGRAEDAYDVALEATRIDPLHGDAWWLVSRAASEPWSALAAALRAAALDSRHLASLLVVFQMDYAHSTPQRGRLALPDGVRAAAEALASGAPIPVKDAKGLFAQLEALMEREPTQLLGHLLAGLLAFEVKRDDYAISHLGFVAAAAPDLGEVHYLAAVAASRVASPARDAYAVEALRAARRAGLEWLTRTHPESLARIVVEYGAKLGE